MLADRSVASIVALFDRHAVRIESKVIADIGDRLVRLLIGPDRILAALDHHDNLEIRVFNPFAYRGDIGAVHAIDGLLNASRVNHRMHNKLMVADNAVALVGGRNVADD